VAGDAYAYAVHDSSGTPEFLFVVTDPKTHLVLWIGVGPTRGMACPNGAASPTP
jgi:hypothetical protein